MTRTALLCLALLLPLVLPAHAAGPAVDLYDVSTGTLRTLPLPAEMVPGLARGDGGPSLMPPSPKLLADPVLRARVRDMMARRPKAVDKPGRTAKADAILGTYRALVLLVDFTDNRPNWYPQHSAVRRYRDMLFSVGTYPSGSMRDWYLENSYGQFQVTGQVTGGAEGWYTAPETYDYYVAGNNGFAAYPRNAQKLVEDAVALADPDVDFSRYDNNGDGVVDSLFVVHTGPGAEATGSPDQIWSHMWSIVADVSCDGVAVSTYSIEPEDGTIGVFCHEYGHILGAADLYDYGNADRGYDSAGLGVWSVMAAGSWGADYNHPGRPSHFDPFHKIMFGWIKPKVFTGSQQGVELPAVETSPTVYKFYPRGVAGKEYYLVENRQKTGFDSLLYNSGLLIYHVDEEMFDSWVNDLEWFPGRDPLNHYAVALEQADARYDLEHNYNVGDAGDPFPGAAVNRVFDLTSSPDSNTYLAGRSGVSLTNVSDSAATMTADFSVGPPDQKTWCVSADATASGNGSSWQSPLPTINRALELAQDRDTIIVAPGVYAENVNFRGKAVLVMNTNPNDEFVVNNTIIRAPKVGPTVAFRHREPRAAILRGFTISHVPGITGGGLNVFGASPTIDRCVIRDNANDAAGSDLAYGGGLLVLSDGAPLVRKCQFLRNSADYGAGIAVGRASVTVVESTFVGNRAAYDGGAVYLNNVSATPTLSASLFRSNEAKRGGGLFCALASPVVTDCDFTENSARNHGGALYLRDNSDAALTRLTISACRAFLYTGSRGGGLYCVTGSDAVIDRLSLWGCSAPQGAGLFCDNKSTPTLTSSIIAGCQGPGIQSQQPLQVKYCDLWGNTGRDVIGFRPAAADGNLSRNPRFADSANGDLHLRSRAGRWTAYGWVKDTVSSPCLDAGDPAVDASAEPQPNGGRINMGAEGGTAEASLSVADTVLSATLPVNGVTASATSTPRGGAQITLSLQSGASVSATIANIAGVTVAALPARDLPAGVSTLLWDGYGRNGTKVAPGQYLVRVLVKQSSGTTAQCLTPLRR